jgi:hypothetical protein
VEALDKDVLAAGRRLLAGGPVCFKLSSRVDAGLLPRWKSRLYVYFCREAPDAMKVPPRPAQQLDVWTSFARALRECKTPDDQLLVMPLNRACPRSSIEKAVECRPRDPADAARTGAVAAVFEGYGGEGGDLEDLRDRAERLIEKCRHV